MDSHNVNDGHFPVFSFIKHDSGYILFQIEYQSFLIPLEKDCKTKMLGLNAFDPFSYKLKVL